MFPLFRTDHLHFAVSVLSLHLCSNVCVFELVLLPAQECWTAVCPCLARFPLSPLCLTFPAHMTHISSKTACICTDLCTFARPPAARRFSFLFVHRHSDSSLPSSCRSLLQTAALQTRSQRRRADIRPVPALGFIRLFTSAIENYRGLL